ncbi:tubby-related protein 4 [Eurytemora carolleeae]|uniref:tubby-related protein 4 n=1 Tax=Eurytemora carolleeae TaxID=1294199 RepID=UPI000C7779A4|nr:tubby-related protein 4 [Eurytemora carolleeae]|eukprot:XP_023327831.1 tubby-related protein 4-like [Eurytemora affinis]
MHLHWERSNNSGGDCCISSLSWMGKVPEEIPEEDGWKLSRNNYYQEGWLATANVRGVVGVTYTTSFSAGGQPTEIPARTNYNLRGHRSEVTLVSWNEPYQKLASCDSTGIIFVWIKYEGRWSIELINDRNTPVKSFAWSHDGRMALICYQDGFVLVGSVAGQRYWSTTLPQNATATCGIWTPEDNQVYIGTVQGDIMVMDLHGNPVTRVELSTDLSILNLTWNCEKFNMEERDDSSHQLTENRLQKVSVLAVSYTNGDIDLVRGHDDVSPIHIHTGFQTMYAEWSNSGEFLAVAGRTPLNLSENSHVNRIKFYRENGSLISSVIIPCYKSPVSALTWGHNDKRIFVATGAQVHIGWINRKIGSLQLLSRLQIHSTLKTTKQVDSLPLPCRAKNLISSLFTQTIKCHVPDRTKLRQFVSRSPPAGLRHYCTMIRHGDEFTGPNYTIYLEHLGGFLPILKGRKTSKLRPEFVIFDPMKETIGGTRLLAGLTNEGSDTDTDTESFTYRDTQIQIQIQIYFGYIGNEEVDYVNNLPEDAKMVEISSNIWGTKFNIHSLDISLPPILGQISYKASLLHLQPRQMRLILTELRDDLVLNECNGNYTNFSEDEEEIDKLTMEDDMLTAVTLKDYPVVAPLPSISNRLSIMDFQKISPSRMDYTDRRMDCTDRKHVSIIPSVAVTVPDSPEPSISSKASEITGLQGSSLFGTSADTNGVSQVQIKHQSTISSLAAKLESLSTDPDIEINNKWPTKHSLSYSKSCENELDSESGDMPVNCLKLGRRDSVGASNSQTSSPNSSIASPRRWAAKAEELREPEGGWNLLKPEQMEKITNSCVRSCSVDHLGALVDILGVPSDAVSVGENTRRLVLSVEKKIEQRRKLGTLGKSRSLDTDAEPCILDTRILLTNCSGGHGTKECSLCTNTDKQKARLRLTKVGKSREIKQESIGSEPGTPVHLPRRFRDKLSVPEPSLVSQSSPNTPLTSRKLKSSKRHQSFSPVRTLLNSPILRRKKSSFDSSDEDITDIHHSVIGIE